MPNHSSILLIEDSPGECELFRLALVKVTPDIALYTEHDVEAALHFLKTQQDLPSLTLLDWHLRHRCGDSFLKHLRSETRIAGIPVVVFTTSDDASDINAAYVNGANGYVVKPSTFDELVHCVRDVCRFWIDLNRTPYFAGATC
jgi:DNA-binding response OmpR family regulator